MRDAEAEITSLEQHVEKLEMAAAETNREAAKELGAVRKQATELEAKEKILSEKLAAKEKELKSFEQSSQERQREDTAKDTAND